MSVECAVNLKCAICYNPLSKRYPRKNCNKECNEQYNVHEKCYNLWLKIKDRCPHCQVNNPTRQNYFRLKNWAKEHGVRTSIACSIFVLSHITARSIRFFNPWCLDQQNDSCYIIAKIAENALVGISAAPGAGIGYGIANYLISNIFSCRRFLTP